MVDRRVLLIFFAVTLLVSVLHAERARNDDLQDEETDMLVDDNGNNDSSEGFVDTMKRFLDALKKKKTTTAKPSSGAISGLVTTTRATPSTTKSYGSTSRFDRTTSSTSRYDRTRMTTKSAKDACGAVNPCKNGGTCKTLSSGSYYCFCSQDYYGKTCDNKFMSTGADNNDRARKDHCAKSPCRNSGECVGLRTTYYCRCKSPYYGTNCDKRFAKREEILDESNSNEQDLNLYERDLQEDNEDLRRAIANENTLEYMK